MTEVKLEVCSDAEFRYEKKPCGEKEGEIFAKKFDGEKTHSRDLAGDKLGEEAVWYRRHG